jgi:hypothetical protein
MVSRYILVAVFSFFSLCALVVCVRTTLSFYLYASTVCVRTSLSFACVHPCVYWYPSSLSFFLWASVASVRTRTYLSLCLFLGYSVTCVCALIVFFILTSLPRVRTMTAFAIPTSLQPEPNRGTGASHVSSHVFSHVRRHANAPCLRKALARADYCLPCVSPVSRGTVAYVTTTYAPLRGAAL